MRRLALCSAVAITIGFCTVSSSSFAQSDDDRNTARSLGQDGQDALDKKDFARAADLFRRAVKIFDEAKAPVPPTLLLGYGRASAGKGGVIAAQEAFNRVIRQGTAPGAPALYVNAVEDAKKEIDTVAVRIATVTINVSGCDNPHVTIDDNPVSSAILGVKKPIDPGTHIVKATATSCKGGEQSFEVGDGKSAEVTIKLDKDLTASANPTDPTTTTLPPTDTNPPPHVAPPETPKSGSPNMALAITGFAVGGVGLALGAITGIVAMGKHGDLAKACPTGVNCPSTLQSDVNSYHTMGTLSTVGFIVGGVGIVAGVIFLLTAPKGTKEQDPKAAWIMPSIGFGTVGAVGQF